MCKYKIVVTSPALMTGVTADLNNIPVELTTKNRKTYTSKSVEREEDADGKIEIDVHVRGRRDAKVTIKVTNETTDETIYEKEDKIGSQDHVRDTRYEVKNKKVKSLCE